MNVLPACVHVHPVQAVLPKAKRVLELELQPAVSHLVGAVTESRSSVRTVSALSHPAISPAPTSLFLELPYHGLLLFCQLPTLSS